jgi:hypothetical protein
VAATNGSPPGAGEHDDELIESGAVRPYTVTGGRTRSTTGNVFPIEALVRVLSRQGIAVSVEKDRILDLAGSEYLSIAEISAHLKLPVGVIRVLVGDLVDEGLASVSGTESNSYNPATSLSVLESVLNGISAL